MFDWSMILPAKRKDYEGNKLSNGAMGAAVS